MNNLKTAFVVVVMLAVLYGVYLVLNKPEPVAVPGTGETPWTSATTTMPEIGLGTPFVPPAASGGYPAEGSPSSPRDSGANGSPATPNAPWPGPAAGPDARPGPIPHEKDSPDLLEPRGPYAEGSLRDDFAFPDGDDLLAQRSSPPPVQSDNSPADANDEVEDRREENPHTSPPSESEGRSMRASAFSTTWAEAQQMVSDGKYREALAALSPSYGNSDLTPDEQEQLEEMLDSLAGKVIYSTEHWMEEPYAPESGETLREIAEQFDVPWELLQNINGIEDPNVLEPGVELKVVRGPFRAEVELANKRLTLFVGSLYAGRFEIEVHERSVPLIGKFFVNARQLWPDYRAGGDTIEANHPDNPYGQWLIDLGGGVKLHGRSPSPATADLGCISLSPRDASDVFGILSVGSEVKIRR